MFNLNSLKGQQFTVFICENSVVFLSDVEKIVLFAQPADYDLNIDPPGIRGCNLPVDEHGNVSVNNCSIFENNKPYTIVDVVSINCEDDVSNDCCYSKIVLSLRNFDGEECTVSLISSKICVDLFGVFDFKELVGKNIKLKLSKNNLIIEQVNDKWMFVSQSDNYVVRIEQEYTTLPNEEQKNIFMRSIENGLMCNVLDINYFDDMLGETTINFNLYFTTLSMTVKTHTNEIYRLEIDTAKMQVFHEQSNNF